MAAAVLHNLLRPGTRGGDEVDMEDPVTHDVIPAHWRSDTPLPALPRVPGRATQNGKEVRDWLRDYCTSEAGSVPWQDSKV